MNIIDVRSLTGSGTTGQLAAFSADPAAGDTIVVFYNHYDHGGSFVPLVPIDTAGNTYVQIGTSQFPAAGSGLSMFYAKNIVGGSTFRVTCRLDSFWCCAAIVVRGLDPTAPYNGDWATANGTATTLAVGPTTPQPPAGSIFLASANINNAAVLADASGWNAIANGFDAGMLARARNADYNNNYDGFLQYKISNTVETPSWTNGTGAVWSAMVASFKPAAASSSPNRMFQTF